MVPVVMTTICQGSLFRKRLFTDPVSNFPQFVIWSHILGS